MDSWTAQGDLTGKTVFAQREFIIMKMTETGSNRCVSSYKDMLL